MALPPKIVEPAFDPARFDIRHVLDIGLAAKRSTSPPRTRSGWTSGNLGYCLRRQMFDRAEVPVVESLPYRTFWIGDLIHDGYQRMMRNAGLLIREEAHLVDEELNLSGYVDMVWGGLIPEGLSEDEEEYRQPWQDFLLDYRAELRQRYPEAVDVGFPVTGDELKSANDFGARKMQSEGPQFTHLMQAASYWLMADRNPTQLEATVDRWRLSIIDKSDGLMNVFEVRESHVAQAEERVGELNDLWSSRTVPPCTCGQKLNWEIKYCKYGDGTEKGCCEHGLIEKAESAEFWEGFIEAEPPAEDAPMMGDMVQD